MNTLQAMRETVKLASANKMSLSSDHGEGLGFTHMLDMLRRAEKGHIDGTPFSTGKLNRWLGWMQCAMVVACPHVDLEQMKEINYRNREDEDFETQDSTS